MTAIARPLPVDDFLARSGRGVYIDGDWRSTGETTLTSSNPADGTELYTALAGDERLVDEAVRAARRALEHGPWRRWPPEQRERLLWAIADALESNADLLAYLETLDNGKPLAAARGDVRDAARWFRYYAGWPSKLTGQTIPVNAADHHVYSVRQPVGVCGLIIPWNYPLGMAAWKLAPALACGCAVVLKPAEQTPLTALLLAELITEAGAPPGVVNVVVGDGSVGAALVRHPDVDKIAFTGSTEVGKEILGAAGGSRMKRVSLEAGGKSPNIVFADADLAVAKAGAAFATFHNLGQDCTAGTRLFVAAPVFDEVVDHVSTVARSLIVGPGTDDRSDLGPVISEEQRRRVLEYVEIGRSEGAHVVVGGGPAVGPDVDAGHFVQPTVLTGVDAGMRVCREEIFGPVVAIQRFESEQEAVRLANDTSFGLGAGIWTTDLATAHRVAAAVTAGTVWINTYNTVEPAVPFGGFRDSGIGREHGWSAIELYSEVKSVWVNLAPKASDFGLTEGS